MCNSGCINQTDKCNSYMEVNIYRQVASWRGWGLFDWGVEDGSVFNWGVGDRVSVST